MPTQSPSAWRAWIEVKVVAGMEETRRSPSAWRAWIEVRILSFSKSSTKCRPPHGGRGLKLLRSRDPDDLTGRPPHGGRGLKSSQKCRWRDGKSSPSAWRAWIEVRPYTLSFLRRSGRPPHGGRGLKF